ncbi:Acetyl-CoA:oxalate CoA-transferase [Lasiodiplodia hormozganensis]|uniref:Acetyl-CoA:oxalate CoA-transferase n=1 Tax=Lasiodiplodia hormozganensis TaxID=869390 RepID=A0AA39YTV2_9PEZI|nr:Acetyl-CoA:oxalate CoA-transferase [Lasiodiplodia hormozganensis]
MAAAVERDVASYSIPEETEKIFHEGILKNPLIAKVLPPEAEELAGYVKFEGSRLPSVPINWRFAESVSSLKALEATMVNVLLKKKYNVQPQKVTINTDHAQLFFMSLITNTLGGEPFGVSRPTQSAQLRDLADKYFPTHWDKHGHLATHHRTAATNIYRCADGRFFHVHGSMDPAPTLRMLGLPVEPEVQPASAEEACWPVAEAVARFDSQTLQRMASDEARQAGTICWSVDEYRASEHGRANAHVGLYEVDAFANERQRPGWWPEYDGGAKGLRTGPSRPLAGLKVVDLTRMVAAPATTRGLAELGASVMRVTSPNVTDHHGCFVDLNWGKWNTCLDFKNEEDRLKCVELIKEADVVVTGYRPGVLDKYGFSYEGLFDICKDRDRGLIVVRENAYGWHGPWSYRSGWQQICDANTGVSLEFGRAMGNDEPVTPVFPNSDYCTGICGIIGTLDALMRRAQDGGSYKVDIALNYYSQWLVNSVGTYPKAVWEDVWARNGKQVFRHYHHMLYTLPRYLAMLQQNSSDVLFKPEFFEDRPCGYMGHAIRVPKPIAQYEVAEGVPEEQKVKPGFNVGTRTNGVDQPRWPKDLMTEIVV